MDTHLDPSGCTFTHLFAQHVIGNKLLNKQTLVTCGVAHRKRKKKNNKKVEDATL